MLFCVTLCGVISQLWIFLFLLGSMCVQEATSGDFSGVSIIYIMLCVACKLIDVAVSSLLLLL